MNRIESWLTGRVERLPPWVHRLAARVHWPLTARLTLVAGLVALLVAFGLYRNCGVGGCPDIDRLAAYQPNGAPVLLDRFGERFADLAPFERVVISLDSLGEHVPNAFIAVEDRRFFEHNGVDWARVLGAALANIRSRSVSQGSSTITMQLARNVFPEQLPGSERTFRRKLHETRVARMIERRFEKREILEMYLNHIYFGGGAYGVEAAARHYFGKSATRLRLSEAAMLAALPKAPAHYHPRRHPERAKQRRDLVLTLMEQQAMVAPETAEESRNARLRPVATPSSNRASIPVGAYFIDVVRDQLEDRFGEKLYRSRLRIYTTVDPVAQRAAERELERRLAQISGTVRKGEGDLQGAIAMVESHTGHVLALVGGRDPSKSRYNRAIHARRQVGSAFKPFVYATALQEGVPASQHISDAPLTVRLSGRDVWEPGNYDGRYEGEVSLRDALVRSRNLPTIRLAMHVGIEDVAATARTAGVRADMDETPALSLGTVAMSPLQLAVAYTSFANLGEAVSPRFVLRVEDADGIVVWEPERPETLGSVRPDVAFIVNDILSDAVDRGTGTAVRGAGYRGVVAGKTGTTNNATDAWFVGYTPDYVAAVWLGYDTPSPLGSAATGGGLAAPVWGRMMRTYANERGYPRDWQRPGGVQVRQIDPASGMLLAEGCQPEYGAPESELFLDGAMPRTACPYRDWWSDLWGRIGGVFGDEGEAPQRDVIIGTEPRARTSPLPPARGRGGERMDRQREKEMEEFLKERRKALERARRRGGGN